VTTAVVTVMVTKTNNKMDKQKFYEEKIFEIMEVQASEIKDLKTEVSIQKEEIQNLAKEDREFKEEIIKLVQENRWLRLQLEMRNKYESDVQEGIDEVAK
jgi:uncharacterized coiled-coil DUF342 family protein